MNFQAIANSDSWTWEGCKTGIYGRGRDAKNKEINVPKRLIKNIICWPVTLWRENISSCVELIAPSSARLMRRYNSPIRLLPPPPVCEAFEACLEAAAADSDPKSMNIDIPAVTIATTRYL